MKAATKKTSSKRSTKSVRHSGVPGAQFSAVAYRQSFKLSNTEKKQVAKHRGPRVKGAPEWVQAVIDYVTSPIVMKMPVRGAGAGKAEAAA